jgi:hypothetical protein
MLVTRSGELLETVPLPGAQGSRAHCRVTVVVEDVTPPLMVFTTVMSQFIAVVAPPGPGPTLLHWASATFAARASLDGMTAAAKEKAAAKTTRTRSIVRERKRRADCGSGDENDGCIKPQP